jgi:anaerobic magnesium-protoporphyrin IX monomethyl ester cyclase
LRAIADGAIDAVGVTVMGGPQVPTAVAVSKAIRARFPAIPIVWGGYFPTLCPDTTLNARYVDYVVRGQGEVALRELLDAILHGDGDATALAAIEGLSWRRGNAEVVHNRDRAFSTAPVAVRLPYDRLEDPGQYLGHTYLGRRTVGYQAALGCRFRCTFCGVAAMFGGKTALPAGERLEQDMTWLRDRYGVDAIQFYDHNFFDREVDTLPLLEVLARLQLPWWCFARSDALVNLSLSAWRLVRRSRLRMAYIGAESPSDAMLQDVRKGTRANQTLEAVEICHRHGVIPELSFMVAPPHDPEGETEQTFEFIRSIKREYPATEIMIYVYTPLPPQRAGANVRTARSPMTLRDTLGRPVLYPSTPDEWAEQRWVDYWCHRDAPWVNRRLHRRIVDFTTVLGCRFPTITDVRSPPWGKQWLRSLASWRYRYRRYERPWELDLSRRFIQLHDPRATSL